MKTIYTVLPIYDKINKQTFERGRYAGMDKPTPIICPVNAIPSFQWRDNGDGCTAVNGVEIIDITGDASSLPLTVVPVVLTSDTYFVYNGGVIGNLDCGLYYLKITMNNGLVYFSEWFKADSVTDCIKFQFSNTCDLGNILYQTSFTQNVWIVSEPMEASFPVEEEGVKNGEGLFIKTFARQTKKYLVKTETLPEYMVDVFNRMKYHDTILITDLVGDINEVFNLEVEHEYLSQTNKYYVQITLTFDYDETLIICGCCNPLTIITPP